MLVEAAGGEGDLRQREVVLGTGQRGMEHQDVALRGGDVVTSSNTTSLFSSSFTIDGSCFFSFVFKFYEPSDELQAATSLFLSRGGKWKKSDCPSEMLLIGLSRLSLLYSFTWWREQSSTRDESVRGRAAAEGRGVAGPTDSVTKCSGDAWMFPLRSN